MASSMGLYAPILDPLSPALSHWRNARPRPLCRGPSIAPDEWRRPWKQRRDLTNPRYSRLGRLAQQGLKTIPRVWLSLDVGQDLLGSPRCMINSSRRGIGAQTCTRWPVLLCCQTRLSPSQLDHFTETTSPTRIWASTRPRSD